MLFRQLFDKISCTYTYLLAADYGCETILIDPVFEQLPLYQRLIEQFNATLTATFETHLHADHITASGPLREQFGNAIIMGAPCAAKSATQIVQDNERLFFDGFDVQCLYTPGHTNDSYCYLIGDRVFTGDTLFIRGTGRTDFQNGDPIQAYHSLFDRLLTLPDETRVYPGHDYKGETTSTIGEEKRFNPRLQVQDAQAYAAVMNNLNLERPQKMDIAISRNILCGLVNESGASA